MSKNNNIVKRIDLSNLPKRSDGKIDWVKSVGYSISFVYGGIAGEIALLDYTTNNQTFKVFIDGYTKYQYDTANIDTLKQCKLGRLLHKKIIDTNPEMIPYFVYQNDTLKYSCQSNVRTDMHCPYCGYTKSQIISNLFQYGFCCPQCSDGISYPNKLMYHILQQLCIDFKHEITRKTPGFEWVNQYRYDFYFNINEKKYFVEMDGHFHKYNRMGDYCKMIKSDIEKDRLATQHDIIMIRIDCCYKSEKDKLKFIQTNIINSDLKDILPLSNIDWEDANKKSITSNIYIAAQYWNSGYTIKNIANQIGVSRDSVTNYLKIAQDLNLCSYNKNDAEKRRIKSCVMARSKPIIVYDTDGSFHVFINASDLSEQSMKIYQRQFNKNSINFACNQHRKLHGYLIEYINREEYEHFLTIQN